VLTTWMTQSQPGWTLNPSPSLYHRWDVGQVTQCLSGSIPLAVKWGWQLLQGKLVMTLNVMTHRVSSSAITTVGGMIMVMIKMMDIASSLVGFFFFFQIWLTPKNLYYWICLAMIIFIMAVSYCFICSFNWICFSLKSALSCLLIISWG